MELLIYSIMIFKLIQVLDLILKRHPVIYYVSLGISTRFDWYEDELPVNRKEKKALKKERKKNTKKTKKDYKLIKKQDKINKRFDRKESRLIKKSNRKNQK